MFQFTWLYNRTRFSLLIAVLTHMGAHINNSNKALPGNTTPLILHTIAYCIAAVIVVLVEKKYFYSAGVNNSNTGRERSVTK